MRPTSRDRLLGATGVAITIFVMGYVFGKTQETFGDFSVSLGLAGASFMLLFHLFPWPYETTLSLDQIKVRRDAAGMQRYTVICNGNGPRHEVRIDAVFRDRPVDQYAQFFVLEKESRTFLVDVRNSTLWGVLQAIILAGASVVVGTYLHAGQIDDAHVAKLIYGLIPLAIVVTYNVAPLLYVKKRNEKVVL